MRQAASSASYDLRPSLQRSASLRVHIPPFPHEIQINDIAHSLSQICRFVGATRVHYSVAQHSVLASELAPRGQRLAALLHDASEAYLADIPRPIKILPELAGYREIEAQTQAAIDTRFGVSRDDAIVDEIDRRLCITEAIQLVGGGINEWGTALGEPYEFAILPWTATAAEAMFMRRFGYLTRRGE
jgi:hypothetical protein